MNRRGPMPPEMRSRIARLFAFVALLMVLPVCLGVPVFLGGLALTVDAYLPTEEDQQVADELNLAADEAGVEMEVSAVEIAHARRLGQLDEVEATAERMFAANPQQKPGAPARPPAPRRDPTAFYPEPTARSPGIWMEIGLGLLGLVLLSAAAAAGWAAFTSLRDPETPPGADEPS